MVSAHSRLQVSPRMRRDTSQLLLIVSDGRGIFLEGMEVSNTFDSSLYVNLWNLGLDSVYAGLARARSAQRSTIGKKFWLSRHPRNFGSDKIVRTYIRPPACSWGKIFHFNYPARFSGKSLCRDTHKQSTKSILCLQWNYGLKGFVLKGHTIGFHRIEKLELNYRSS